jgi:cation:H+ antiporter
LASRSKSKELAAEFEEGIDKPSKSVLTDLIFFVGGLGTLVFGAKLLIDGAVTIARYLDISDVVIGLSIIAIGTSLPELATSAMASLKKESDLALGNAIGSNIVNILLILGIASIIAPISAAEIRTLDMSVMLGSCLFLWALLGFRFLLDRFEAAILIFVYAVYIYTLIP